MPIDLRVDYPGGSQTFVVQNVSVAQDFALPPVPSPPTSVSLDPDLWILKWLGSLTLPDADADGVPDTADHCPSVADPAQEDLDGDGLGDACDPDRDGDGRVNGADCAPSDPTAMDPPLEVTGVQVSGAATALLSWTPPAGAQATWSCDVVRGDALRLLVDGGMAAAVCLGAAPPGGGFTDVAVPPSGGAFYYLVRARNVCGAGPIGSGSPGAPPRPSPACP
jgi:hypothetical protein